MALPHERKTGSLLAGFSLTELLVATALGAILLLLGATAASRYRQKAEQTSCMANLRQLFVGLTLYAAEHHGKFPTHFDSTTSRTWASTLGLSGVYLPLNASTFGHYSCPSGAVMEEPANQISRQVDTYGMITEADGVASPPFHLLPPNTPILCDSAFLFPGSPRYQKQYYYVAKQTWYTGVALRHGGRANLIFADGHGAALSKDDLQDRARFPPLGFRYFLEE